MLAHTQLRLALGAHLVVCTNNTYLYTSYTPHDGSTRIRRRRGHTRAHSIAGTFEEALLAPEKRIDHALIEAGADDEARRVMAIIDVDRTGEMTYDEFRQWFVDNTIELEGRVSAYDLYAGRVRPGDDAEAPHGVSAPPGRIAKPSGVAGTPPLPAEELKTPLTSRPRTRRCVFIYRYILNEFC